MFGGSILDPIGSISYPKSVMGPQVPKSLKPPVACEYSIIEYSNQRCSTQIQSQSMFNGNLGAKKTKPPTAQNEPPQRKQKQNSQKRNSPWHEETTNKADYA